MHTVRCNCHCAVTLVQQVLVLQSPYTATAYRLTTVEQTVAQTVGHTTGMQKAYDFLWGTQHLAAEIRKEPLCTKMTDADLISILGYVAVVQAGGCAGKGCGWYPGR
jgi:hypothetical protein